MTFDEVKDFWASKYPQAVVVVKEVQRRSQLPKWEDCSKNEIHVGIVRRSASDKVICVRHKIELIGDLSRGTRFENLDVQTLFKLGVIPLTSMICPECKEFSSRMDIDVDGNCICHECNNKSKEKGQAS